MATVWMTYAWADNQQRDVDFVAQELIAAGVQVKLDRWNLTAEKRLWDQIANFTISAIENQWISGLYPTTATRVLITCRTAS